MNTVSNFVRLFFWWNETTDFLEWYPFCQFFSPFKGTQKKTNESTAKGCQLEIRLIIMGFDDWATFIR